MGLFNKKMIGKHGRVSIPRFPLIKYTLTLKLMILDELNEKINNREKTVR